MKKGKAITLLSIVCLVMAFLVVMTFARFPVGVKNYNGVLGAIELDYDIAGGTAYDLTLAKDNLNEVEDIDEVIATLKTRMAALGYQTYSVKAIKNPDKAVEDYNVRIEAKARTNQYGDPDTSALSADIKVAAAYGELKFYGGSSSSPTDEILTDGKVIESAKYEGIVSGIDETYHQVVIKFTDYAYKEIMSQIEAGTFYLKIMLGDTTLMSGSDALQSSYFNNKSLGIYVQSEAGARQAALQISSGGLPYLYEVSGGVSVTSPFGPNVALISAITVAAIALAMIIAFHVFYKGYGLIAGLTVILFLLIETLMMIAVPGIVLNLGGVIGIAFATILTVDGLMIIIKRVCEEYANGKMVKTAVKTGFRRSLMPVISTAVISGIVAILLIIFAAGAVKGFAITFGIGTVVSLLSNLLFARMFAALVLPIANYNEKFLNLKRAEA